MSMKNVLFMLLVLLLPGSVFPTAAQIRELRLALPEGDAISLDPHEFNTLSQSWVLRNVLEGLVTYDPHTLQPAPALAESWDVSNDGLVYTFHLREGVKFHNGVDVTAREVLLSFKRLANPPEFITTPTDAASLIIGSIAGYGDLISQGGSADTLSGIRAVDDLTVEFTLSAPNSAFLAALTMIPAVIVPSGAANSGAYREQPVGTGPFIVRQWVHLNRVELVANPDYWGGKPAIDRVTLRVIHDPAVQMAEFLAGNLDYILVPPTDLAAIKNDPTYEGRIQDQTLLSIWWMPLNLTRPPLDNLQVRQAMSVAIDREFIVNNVLQGQGAVAHGPLPPGLSAYNPDYNPFPYDPNRARQLLADAGFTDGIDVEIRTWTDEVENRVLAAVQANWANVGIRATFNRTEYSDYMGDLSVCNLQIGTSSWTAQYADPDNFFIPLPLSDDNLMGQGCGYGQVSQVEDLSVQAKSLPPGAERDEVYRQAEREAVENVMGIFLFHRGQTLVWGANVQGAYLDANNEVRLYPISLS